MDLENLRTKALQETQQIAMKPRFALFSQLPSLSIGNNFYIKKNTKKNQNGRIITQKPNIKVGSMKSGKLKQSFFSLISFSSLSDPYIDSFKNDLIKDKSKKQDVFRPQNCYKSLYQSVYEYMDQTTNNPNPKKYRDKNGKIIIQKPNIHTNPNSFIQNTYFSYPKYQFSSYDAPKQLHKQQRLKHLQLIQQHPFIPPSSNLKQLFSPPLFLQGDKKIKKSASVGILHQTPFRPPSHLKKGIIDNCFSRYPEFMPSYPIVKKQKKQKIMKDVFKPRNAEMLTRPTPSITKNKKNIFNEFNKKIY